VDIKTTRSSTMHDSSVEGIRLFFIVRGGRRQYDLPANRAFM